MTAHRIALLLGALTVSALSSAMAQELAPAAKLQPLNGGEAIDLRAASGMTELIFVARWCGPCERQTVQARRRQAEFQRQGYRVVVVGVDQRQSADDVKSWTGQIGWEGAVVFDGGKPLEKGFGVKLLPWHVVIGPGGKLLHSSETAPESTAIRGWLAG